MIRGFYVNVYELFPLLCSQKSETDMILPLHRFYVLIGPIISSNWSHLNDAPSLSLEIVCTHIFIQIPKESLYIRSPWELLTFCSSLMRVSPEINQVLWVSSSLGT